MYTCYVAVHVPLKNALDAFDEVVDELGVLQNDYDREKCRNWMEAELNKQAAAKEAEKKELQDLRLSLVSPTCQTGSCTTRQQLSE